MNTENEFGGILRGVVVDNNDPDKLGRLKIRVPAAYGDQPADSLPWAWPCFPYGGAKDMCSFALPEIGAGVYVIFQNNDGEPDTTYPVWVGSWQSEYELPKEITGDSSDAHYYKEFKSTSGHYILFCDKPGNEAITIKDNSGSFILMKNGNIDINAQGTIRLTASRIDLN